jgi:DNA helicase HerA-like ATPase
MRDGFQTMVGGKTGTGKSYFTKKKIIPALKDRPVIILDPKGEYAGPRSVDSDKNWKGFKNIFEFFDFLGQQKVLKPGVYVIQTLKDKEYVYALSLFNALGKPCSILIDEAHNVLRSSSKEMKKAKEILVYLTRAGRSMGIDIILISQRFYDIPTDIRSQFESAFSFRQTLENDVKALEANNFSGAEKVLALDKREYISLGVIAEPLKHLKNK